MIWKRISKQHDKYNDKNDFIVSSEWNKKLYLFNICIASFTFNHTAEEGSANNSKSKIGY